MWNFLIHIQMDHEYEFVFLLFYTFTLCQFDLNNKYYYGVSNDVYESYYRRIALYYKIS
jgi:hypothetical protein